MYPTTLGEDREESGEESREQPDTAVRIQLIIDTFYGGVAAAFAREIGVSSPALHKYLKGERDPGSRWLRRVARLGYNVHWLVADEGSMFAPNDAGRGLYFRYLREHPTTPALEAPSNVSVLQKPSSGEGQRTYTLQEVANLLSQMAKDQSHE